MSHTAPDGDGHISRVNSAALRAQIGERLRLEFDADRTDTPLYLQALMQRFEQAR